MDRTHDTHTLHTRLIELETALRRPGGISILEERELLAIRRRIDREPNLLLDTPMASHAHGRSVAAAGP